MRAKTILALLLIGLAAAAYSWWPSTPDLAPSQTRETNAATTSRAEAEAAQNNPIDALEQAENPSQDEPDRTAVVDASAWVVRGRTVSGVEQPLANANVRARAFAGTEAVGEPFVETMLTSDAAGQFTWPLQPPAQIMFLELRGSGDHVRSYAETFLLGPGDPPPDPFDLWVMPLLAKVRGRVLDAEERPVAGAHVGSSLRDDSGVDCDADGRFEVPVEHKAQVRLYVSAPGFVLLRQEVSVDLDTGVGEAELHLRTANRIHGRVTDDNGAPVAGATVRTFFTIYDTPGTTDADGRFVLDNLDPSLASHDLFARKEGYIEAREQVQAKTPDVEQDLVLRRGVEVRGIVVDTQGRPVPAATVFLGFSPSAYNRQDAVSDLAGAFRFACVAAGEHTLNVERRGFSGLRQQIQVPPPPSNPVVVPVRLEPGHFLGGRTLDSDGKPLAGVSIAPRLDGEYLDAIRGKSDEDGRFRLEGLPAQGLSLEFYGAGILRATENVTAVDHETFEVRLPRHGRMAGTVVDGRTGKPVTDFRIRFGRSTGGGYSASWVRGGKGFHDERGVFRIDEEVSVGAVFALEASADGYGPGIDEHVVAVLDPDPAAVVIRLYPGAVIEGAVREQGTAVPIAGAKLTAFSSGRPLQPHEPNDLDGRPTATSDAAGRFRLENVGPGEISIAVTHADWLPRTQGPITVTPDVAVPQQEIALERGVDVTVDVRDVDGKPVADALVQIAGTDARSDATGAAILMRIAPGERQLRVTIPSDGTFTRSVNVGREPRRLGFVASDGDATLVVTLSGPETMPDNTQIMVMAGGDGGGSFQSRTIAARPGRTTIAHLPAAPLRVMVYSPGGMGGNATVTTVAGATTQVTVTLQPPQRR